MAGDALLKSKLRSVLSVLGITIGIYCIIIVYALVHSMEKNLNDSFSGFGTDVLFVQKWPWDEFGGNYPWWKYLSRPQTTIEEAGFLEKYLSAQTVSAIAFSFGDQAKVEHGKHNVSNVGMACISYQYNLIQKVDVENGRYFTSEEVEGGRPVAIIGHTLAEELFPGEDPVGKPIRFKNQNAQVIGVCRKEGQSVINASSDNRFFIPVKFAVGFMNYKEDEMGSQIMVKAAPGVTLDELQVEVNQIMRRVRRLKPFAVENFAVNRMSMITDTISKFFGTVTVIGVVIGLFSMLVGCFGVANIMFVSVKERTGEIGIQKALGAKKIFILLQFLIESVWLCLLGGMVGLGLVWLSLKGFGYILEHQMDSAVKLFLSPGDISMGIIVSVLVGLVAGMLPAWSAAKLSPIDAMRFK